MKRIVFAIFYTLLLGRVYLFADVLAINKFSGLNTDDSPLQLTNGQTPDSENVITDQGPGFQGRLGFIFFSTEPSAGLWEFPLSDGTRYIITKTGSNLKAATSDGVFDILVATVTADRVTAGSVLGDRFYFSDTLNGLKYWAGSGSAVTVDSSLTFDKLVTFKGRLAGAGISAAQRQIRLSKYLDGTSWTAPNNPSDDDAAIITVSGALDENIQALYATFQDKLMWFKPNSFGGIYGSRRSNFIQRTYSDRIGVSSPETIQDCDGFLRWLGPNRTVWEFDGATYRKISENVDDLFDDIDQGDSAAKSNLQTTQTDWEAGSQSPTGFADTSSIPGSIYPAADPMADTLTAEFAAGTATPSGYLSTTSDQLYLATAAAISSFTDTAQADFAAGTLSSLNSTGEAGSLYLSSSAVIGYQCAATAAGILFTGPNAGCPSTNKSVYQSFQSTAGFVLRSITLTLNGTAGNGGLVVELYSDSSGSPGSLLLAMGTIPEGSISTGSPAEATISNGPYMISPNTRYWIKMTQVSTTLFSAVRINSKNATCNSTSEKSGHDTSASACAGYTAFNTSDEILFKINGDQYVNTGNIVSREFDVGFTTNTWLWDWSTFTANSRLPSGGTITYEAQTAATSGGSYTALDPWTSGGTSTATVQRYIRYKATFTTTDQSTSPVLTDVTLAMSNRVRPGTNFISRSFDTGEPTPSWGTLSISSVMTAGTIQVFTQSSADNSTWDSRLSCVSGQVIPSARQRYFRYQIDFDPQSENRSAALLGVQDISFFYRSTGTFTTQAASIGNQITAWGPVGATLDNNGGSFTIQFATSTDGSTFNTWTTITNNTVPSVSTAPYAKTRFIYALDVGTDTPTLNDVTINWVEGSNIRAASAYYNQRYWLSVALSSTTNNRVFVYDRANEWQRYNGINATALATYSSQLYFGNTSGIFQAESGHTDNGSSIASYYTTPTYATSGFDYYSKYLHLYTLTDNSDSILVPSYQFEGNTDTTYTLGSSTMNTSPGIQIIKTPFPVTEAQQGRLLSLKWSITGTSFWRLLSGNLYFDKDQTPF